MNDFDRVKIVIAGDSGVGKSALTYLVCNLEPLTNPGWTIGCNFDVKIHDYMAGTPQQRPVYVELWDVGGWSSHANTRSIFYQNVHGIVLVHDLTNKKSEQNLKKWLTEILNENSDQGLDCVVEESISDMTIGLGGWPPSPQPSYRSSSGSTPSLPVLVVGTKLDLIGPDELRTYQQQQMRRGFAVECNYTEILLSCDQAQFLAPGSGNAVLLDRFFDKVVNWKLAVSKDFGAAWPSTATNLQSNASRRLNTGVPLGNL